MMHSMTSIIVDENNPNCSSDEYGVLFNKDKTELQQYPIGNTRTSYTIPDSVRKIVGYAFSNCTSLESVTITNSVTSIDDYAFYNCISLDSVIIPVSVTSIGEYTTTTEIRNAEGNVAISNTLVQKYTVDGTLVYEMPKGAYYTIWIRMQDGTSYILPLDVTNFTPTVTTYGVKVTLHNLYDVKDFYIAKGEY